MVARCAAAILAGEDKDPVAVLAAAAAWACRLLATALQATVPSTASPSAPPTC